MTATTTNLGLQVWDNITDYYDSTQLVNNWVAIDNHDHDPLNGKGVQIDTGGIKNGAITNVKINASANIADTKLATISTAGKVANSATTATSSNTSNAIVARDASGDFNARNITATTVNAELNGNAKTVTNGVYKTDTGTVTNLMLAGSISNDKLQTIAISGKVANSATTATASSVNNAIVLRDNSGDFYANTVRANLIGNVTGNVVGNLQGNAATVTNGVTTTQSGTVTGTMIASNTVTNANIKSDAAIVYTKLNLTNSIQAADLNSATLIPNSNLATITSAGKVANSATTATNALGANTIVSRDGSNNFSAGTITASLNGNANTATNINSQGPNVTLPSNVVASSIQTLGNQAQPLNMNSNKIIGLAEPTLDTDAATQNYVKTYANGLKLNSATMLPDGPVNFNNVNITGVNTIATSGGVTLPTGSYPSQDNHASTKLYVDQQVAGFSKKPAVDVATTANISSFPPSGSQTIDGVTVTPGQRVLVKNQTNQAENGIWVVGTPWTRATDLSTWNDPYTGAINTYTLVLGGNTNYGTSWSSQVSPGTVGTIGVTPIPFIQYGTAPQINAGDGLQVTGPASVALKLDGGSSGLSLSSNGIKIGSNQSNVISTLGNITTGTINSAALTVATGDITVTSGNISGNVNWNGNVINTSKLPKADTANAVGIASFSANDFVVNPSTTVVTLNPNANLTTLNTSGNITAGTGSTITAPNFNATVGISTINLSASGNVSGTWTGSVINAAKLPNANASSSTDKGIASFNTSNFNVTSGAVSLIPPTQLGTQSQSFSMGGTNRITNVADPRPNQMQDVATKNYVDSTYQFSLPSGAVFPSTPQDGQLFCYKFENAILGANTTYRSKNTIFWQFMYSASLNGWQFMQGTPLVITNNAVLTTTNNVGNWSNNGVSITLPSSLNKNITFKIDMLMQSRFSSSTAAASYPNRELASSAITTKIISAISGDLGTVVPAAYGTGPDYGGTSGNYFTTFGTNISDTNATSSDTIVLSFARNAASGAVYCPSNNMSLSLIPTIAQ